MIFHQTIDAPQFSRTKAKIPRERHGRRPELGRLIIAVDVDVRRFVRLVAVKVHTVGPCHEDGRHGVQYRIAGLQLRVRSTCRDCPSRVWLAGEVTSGALIPASFAPKSW